MGVLECHQLTALNKMEELKTPELCLKNQVKFMVEVQIRIFLMDKLKFKSEYYSEINSFIYYSEINSLNHITLLIRAISHILKNENYELCFLVGSFVDQITTGKKVQSSGRWLEFWGVPSAWIVLAGSLIK
jgi:hypothetical protein